MYKGKLMERMSIQNFFLLFTEPRQKLRNFFRYKYLDHHSIFLILPGMSYPELSKTNTLFCTSSIADIDTTKSFLSFYGFRHRLDRTRARKR